MLEWEKYTFHFHKFPHLSLFGQASNKIELAYFYLYQLGKVLQTIMKDPV